MIELRTVLAAVVIPVAIGASSGCAVSSDSDGSYVTQADGRLTLRWTVDEVNDPNACVMGVASGIDVRVSTAGGVFVGEYRGTCTDFATSIAPLAPGAYTASAQLVDAAAQPRTTPVALNPFTIRSGEELIVAVDFPANSFL